MEFSDFLNFNKFVSPILIKIIYWIGLVLIVLSTLCAIFGSSLLYSAMGGSGGFSMGGLLLSLLGGTFAALIWRVVCEIWIVMFSINDRLGVIAERSRAP